MRQAAIILQWDPQAVGYNGKASCDLWSTSEHRVGKATAEKFRRELGLLGFDAAIAHAVGTQADSTSAGVCVARKSHIYTEEFTIKRFGGGLAVALLPPWGIEVHVLQNMQLMMGHRIPVKDVWQA